MAAQQEWYVYRAINNSRKEVYHGVTIEPLYRIIDHCLGKTKALKHWNCEKDDLLVKIISVHKSHQDASAIAHDLEKKYRSNKGYKNIRTAGK
ncbi:MAG TPA: GIY-YIG nuclease family protein [Bacteroidales bacterium]|nr:GIY-YIG nuclease family protein [Bacteroidales bacterium]